MHNDMEITTTKYILRSVGGPLYTRTKRIMDLVVSAVSIAVSLPLWVLIALAIKIDSKGPILYRQRRVGLDGKEFVMYKFRSMRNDADPKVHEEAFAKYANGEHVEEDEHGSRFKAACDPRVTRIGRILRDTDIDELPQLWNVVKGEMSIVGPRPAIGYELKWYDKSHHQRYSVLPGITGLWQVSDRYRIDMEEMMQLDIEYVRNRSLVLDIKIVIQTVLALIWEFARMMSGKRSK